MSIPMQILTIFRDKKNMLGKVNHKIIKASYTKGQ